MKILDKTEKSFPFSLKTAAKNIFFLSFNHPFQSLYKECLNIHFRFISTFIPFTCIHYQQHHFNLLNNNCFVWNFMYKTISILIFQININSIFHNSISFKYSYMNICNKIFYHFVSYFSNYSVACCSLLVHVLDSMFISISIALPTFCFWLPKRMSKRSRILVMS